MIVGFYIFVFDSVNHMEYVAVAVAKELSDVDEVIGILVLLCVCLISICSQSPPPPWLCVTAVI